MRHIMQVKQVKNVIVNETGPGRKCGYIVSHDIRSPNISQIEVLLSNDGLSDLFLCCSLKVH